MNREQAPGAAQGRFENIDVLRGIAALMVLWLHSSEVYVRIPQVRSSGTWIYDLASFFEFGRAGVVAFFAISGFVVASTIKPPKFEGTIQFAIKRFFRLYPAYWLTLALSYILIWGPQDKVPAVGPIVANATMLPTVFGVVASLGHFWTLEIEFFFYLLVVILFLAGKLSKPKLIVPLIGVLSIVFTGRMVDQLTWTDGQGHWSQLPQCLAIMLWSSLLRRSYDAHASPLGKLRAWKTTPIIIASAFVFGRALNLGGLIKHDDLVTYLSGLGTLWGLLIFVAFALTGRGWPRWMVWLGTISYSIYLLHPLVLHPLNYFLLAHPLPSNTPLWVLVTAVAIATVAVASLTYLLIEAPCNRLAMRLADRFKSRVSAVRTGDAAIPSKRVMSSTSE